MTASNTHIRIKRSSANTSPDALQAGELAYSYLSNTAFIGTADGLGVLKLGGAAYTAIIDAATSASTSNTLVLRDIDGSFSANVITANNISVSGGDINVSTVHATTIYGALGTATGVSEGTWGSSTQVPVLDIAANGLITSVTTANISTTMGFTDGTTTETLNLIDGTLSVLGANGITSAVTANTITISVDDTILRANAESAGIQHISTDLEISGNLTVQGTTTYINTAINQTSDSLIELAANNTVGDVLDIGFYGKHEQGGQTVATGLVRNAGSSDYYLFDNIALGDQTDLTSNLITQGSMSANGASLYAKQFMAAQGNGTNGFSFTGDGGLDTGMFSPADGELQFYSNAQQIFTANTDVVYFERDLKLKSSGTFNNPANSSGDGSGYSTLELRPDTTLITDQYIVVDPTSPNHIHLRAGGAINSSNAELFIGGENNFVKVSDSAENVVIKSNTNNNWTFANNGTLTLPNGTTISDVDSGFFVDSLREDATANDIVYYNTTTKEMTYGTLADIRADVLSNGAFAWTISGTDGSLTSNVGTQIAASANSTVIGTNIDTTNGNSGRVAIGDYAGATSQAVNAVAIGNSAGYNAQSEGAVAIGYGAGNITQGFKAVAIGQGAGNNNQGGWSTAVGLNAGNTGQGTSAVAVGHRAGGTDQGTHAVAVGVNSGQNTQGQGAVALGYRAGYGGTTSQGQYAIAIGAFAAEESQVDYSIVMNASGSPLNATNTGLYINPIRYVDTQDSTYDGIAFYNASTKEMTYSYILDGGDF